MPPAGTRKKVAWFDESKWRLSARASRPADARPCATPGLANRLTRLGAPFCGVREDEGAKPFGRVG